ncbi:MAG TPA: PAS domain S-box protein [Thermomicrobiales bacterium]|nr:PAS domain S-box protein [Thermomicrobiales bacterium]
MSAEAAADLQGRNALLTSLYGQLPVGVAIFDLDLRLQHANASWASFVEYATGIPTADLIPGVCLTDVMRADDDFLSSLQLVRSGQVFQKTGRPFPGPAGETYWDVSLAPILENGMTTGIISVIADATDRIVAERSATARARLVAFRADISQALASSDDINIVLQACAEAMIRHAPAAFGRIWVLDPVEDVYRLRASAGLYTRLDGEYSRIPVDWIHQNNFAGNTPEFASDLHRTHQVRDLAWAKREGLVAWVTHPLIVRGQIIGLIVMFGQQNFGEDTLEELASVADAIAQFLERKHAETALREREDLFRRVFEAAADGLIITDLESGKILEVNPAICAMHGYTREEFTNLSRGKVIHPDAAEKWHDYVATIRSGRTARANALAMRKDGSSFHAEAQGSLILYQGKPAALGVIRDITHEQEQHRLLEQRVDERTRELQTLLDISRTVTLTPEIEPLIELIFDQMQRLVPFESAAIALAENGMLTTVAVRRDELGAKYPSSLGISFSIDSPMPGWRELMGGRTVYTPNVYGDDEVATTFRWRVGDAIETVYAHVVSFLAAPLMVKNELLGVMFISSAQEDRYTQHDIDLVTATANQVAVAIQNTRLHGQSREVAALEERQRLARELHDSVSQALYGIGLGARTARTQLDRDPAKATAPLDYVLQLAEAGMAEMRALIFELRPESLEHEGLVVALEKQAAATRARHMIAVNLSLGEEPQCPIETKEMLYRIAQEAMHNTVKHARATTIDLRLTNDDGCLLLDIMDNGRGFDTSGSFPGHLGLISMRERAERACGTLTITSTPGSGTHVHVEVPE